MALVVAPEDAVMSERMTSLCSAKGWFGSEAISGGSWGRISGRVVYKTPIPVAAAQVHQPTSKWHLGHQGEREGMVRS